MLDPRRIVRWVTVGRVCVASAILLAALFRWRSASDADTQVATLAFALAAAWTGVSAWSTEVRRRPPGRALAIAQACCDLVLTTAVVHVTGGGASQFAALYILVIAAAALLLPYADGLLAAALACVLYGVDALWLRPAPDGGMGAWLQLGVFAVVAAGSGYASARLRQAGAGGERLAAALARATVEAADILRNIRSGILTVDAEGRLLFCNPAASMLLGVDLAPRIGLPVLGDIAPVAPELADVLRRAAARRERTTRAEGSLARGGQTYRIGVTTTVSDAPAGEHGALTTGTAIFTDITDSKRLQALHLRAERLEAVAELSASLAHEIKNPLASIRSAVEQLARLSGQAAGGLAADDADDVRTLAGLTVRESDRLSGLLTEFLDFARARVTRIERVDLAEVAREAARVAAAHPSAHGADGAPGVHVLVTAPETPAWVDGDEALLHRALFNLALNAVQATASHAAAHAPSGERVARRVRVEVQLPDAEELPGGLAFEHGAAAVHVSDDGGGIAHELLDRLFDPFFTTKPGGTGLGLAVVQRAVEAHRGVVLVEGGGTGSGARFTVLLPRPPPDALPALTPARPYLPTPAGARRAVV